MNNFKSLIYASFLMICLSACSELNEENWNVETRGGKLCESVTTQSYALNEKESITITECLIGETVIQVNYELNDSDGGNSSDLSLHGDMEVSDLQVALNYADYNYFFISANTDLPVYFLDEMIDESITEGKLILDGWSDDIQYNSGGDFTYWCSCGGSEDEPGDCVSSSEDGTIRCVPTSGGNCFEGCKGWVENASIALDGGVLIKTSASVDQIEIM